MPKDFSSLALQINTDMWEKAGLTDADIPTTWDQLTEVSKKLTSGKVAGLGIGVGIDRLGAFVVQNGGWWLNADNTAGAAADAKVTDALKYVQDTSRPATSRCPTTSARAGVGRPSASSWPRWSSRATGSRAP
ncbi:hypothetical protein BN11_500008 [Nostocoides australiense Ben110]|uniref:Extracellular solute-binding protein family 1 n=1 Tax=Nostocoides australiense Ben110 TaxID=1193182 RepID=W6K1U2_9MICO|nr:hypothetical protein BN11_500008 [Tetrasphaera australiensis Ben110]